MRYEEWTTFSLGDLCEVRSSKRIFLKDYVSNGVPFYRSKEIILKHKNQLIDNELFISKEKFEEVKEKYGVPNKDDILLTSVGTLGVPYMVKENEEFYFKDGNLTWFTSFKPDVNPKFIYYWLLSPLGKQEIEAITIGSTQKALTMISLRKMKIKLPSIEIQNKIVEVIFSIDSLIQNNVNKNRNLEKISQTLFKHWFIDFEFPDSEGRPYKSNGGKMVESELGMIPENWSVGSLKDLGEVVGGGTPSKKKKNYFAEKGIPWITPKDLSGGKTLFIYNGSTDISMEGLKNSSAKLYPKGTVLYSSRAPIGYVAIAGKDVSTNQGFKSIIPAEGVPSEYLYLLLKYLTPIIEANASGSTFKEISGAGMKAIKTILPTKEVLSQYHQITSSLFEKIRATETEIGSLEELRDILLPKLLSGEIELPQDGEVMVHESV